MNSKEFINKIIDFSKEQINYYENKVVEDEQYPSLQQCHQEELKSAQEGFNHFLKIKQDLEILELIKKHLYVANGLVEMKITSEEYAIIHKVKFHNGIPIANEEAIDKINKWFWRNFNDE